MRRYWDPTSKHRTGAAIDAISDATGFSIHPKSDIVCIDYSEIAARYTSTNTDDLTTEWDIWVRVQISQEFYYKTRHADSGPTSLQWAKMDAIRTRLLKESNYRLASDVPDRPEIISAWLRPPVSPGVNPAEIEIQIISGSMVSHHPVRISDLYRATPNRGDIATAVTKNEDISNRTHAAALTTHESGQTRPGQWKRHVTTWTYDVKLPQTRDITVAPNIHLLFPYGQSQPPMNVST